MTPQSGTITSGLTFDGGPHVYELDGREVANVTSLIERYGMIDKRFFTEEARERGSAVHLAIHLHLLDDLVYESLDPRVQPFFDAYLQFERDRGAHRDDVLGSELKLGTYALGGVAGTLDRLEISRLMDYKTGQPKWADYIQLFAYRWLLRATVGQHCLSSDEVEGLELTRIWLRGDGTYRLHALDRVEREKYAQAANCWAAILALHGNSWRI